MHKLSNWFPIPGRHAESELASSSNDELAPAADGDIDWQAKLPMKCKGDSIQAARHGWFFRMEREIRQLRACLEAERANSAKLRAALELQRGEALTDPLTGLCNRRAMDQRFGELWSDPGDAPLAVLLLDIDFFKRINDTFGHADGDCVIRRVAATLCRCIRAGDSAFRYGGEEFLVLLPDTTLEGAISVAESIRGRIESLHLSFSPDWQVPLTVSLGVAARKRQDDPLSLFERADRALYQAKQHGRNRVVHENCLI